MADYSGAYERDCDCRASIFSEHQSWCSHNKYYEEYKIAEQNNLRTIFIGDGPDKRFIGYRCANGCGCIIWDVHAHMENVCRRKED